MISNSSSEVEESKIVKEESIKSVEKEKLKELRKRSLCFLCVNDVVNL
jgi:hypothetical protein